MDPVTLNTNWALVDGRLEPDLSAEPAPPEGYYRSGAFAPVPAGHDPEPGEAVTVELTYTELPPAPPEPEPAPEPTLEPDAPTEP